MSIETALLCGVLIAISLYLIVTPFRTARTISPEALAFQRQRDTLLVYYQQVTSSLRDLQDDAAAGKLSPDDYQAEYDKWMQRGMQILQALQTLDSQHGATVTNGTHPSDSVDQAIEDAVEHYLKSHEPATAVKD